MNSSVMTLQMNQINENSWLSPPINNHQNVTIEFDMQYDRLSNDNNIFMSSPDSSKTSCNSDTITDDVFAELETIDKEGNKLVNNYQMPYNIQKSMTIKEENNVQYYKNIPYQNSNINIQKIENNNGVDLYRDLILRHLVQDINSTCMRLYLPNNPAMWSVQDTTKWISEMCTQFRLKIPQNLFLSGRILLSMTQEEFLHKAPESGETLYAQLQLWKTAFDSCNQNVNITANNFITPINTTTSINNQTNRKDPDLSWQQQSSSLPSQKGTLYSNEQNITNKHFYQNNTQHIQHQPTSHQTNFVINTSPVPIPNNNRQYCPSSTGSLSSSLEFNRNHNFEMYFNQPISKNIQNNMMSPSNSASSSNSSIYNEEDEFSNILQPNNQQIHYTSSPVTEYFQGNISMNMSEQKHSIYNCDNVKQSVNFVNGNCLNNNNNVEIFNNVNVTNDVVKINSDPVTPTTFQRSSGTVHLWHFIRELLDQPNEYSSCVRWVDRNEGTFKIESSHHLARYWGIRKNRAQMNYDKLSRSLRQYYKKGIIQKPEKKQRLVYKFLPPYNM
ncbi:DNA-binding protein D-ETS-4 [Strongyloides ratti]|uniref:DNA-binding protein D-ETS-4 n=1 Tax=Strongyloides ratti TaxID=34506 RepID=A0A090LMD3_STRRB|nr:DNA-binding protein D-ETS-4 [Strongyloides ratti]CEF71015.1 DNA-binding protein D-ETS-4 [Strongyloides ratti]